MNKQSAARASTPSSSIRAEQVGIPYLDDNVPNRPARYEMKDWNQTAKDFDELVFDAEKSGHCLPILGWDDSRKNLDKTTFKLPTYVTNNEVEDGTQEALAAIFAVLGGTLVGIDKSNQTGPGYKNTDFVQMTQNFQNPEGIITNGPVGNMSKNIEFWYMLNPMLAFAQLDWLYPSVPDMDSILRTAVDKWYEAVVAMGGAEADFERFTFDFTAMTSHAGINVEPEAAAGAGLLLYYAYQKWKEPRYLEAAGWCMDFLERRDKNPLYENLSWYAPLLAARLNAEQGRQYDVEKTVNWMFSEDSAPQRTGWGMIMGNWGGYEVHGLMGHTFNSGGYAFAMNTFYAGMALVPVARYDQRFARAIGKWMLHAANHARYFYADAWDEAHQDCSWWKGDPKHCIPYEGLRNVKRIGYELPFELDESITPFATGDAIGWDFTTNFAVYGGALSGVFGGMVRTTNVSEILQLNLLTTDFFREDAYPSFLYYNPYDEAKSVEIDTGPEKVDLYDAVSDSYLAEGVSGMRTFELAADSAAVLVLVPSGAERIRNGSRIEIGDTFVGWRP